MQNRYRNADGSNNNPDNADLGRAGTNLTRLDSNGYADGIGTMDETLPNARDVSNAIFDQQTNTGNEAGFSTYMSLWGQFLDHDLSLSPHSEHAPEYAPILMPSGDKYFDPQGLGTAEMNFTRSVYEEGTGTAEGGVRAQINEITPFIDASNVYGSDNARMAALRNDDGTLIMSEGDLLGFNTAGLPNAPTSAPNLFLAGDVRANENVALTSLHTLFAREHNRIVEDMRTENPTLDGNTLFNEARKIVEAEMQIITYNEFLPKLIGENAIADYSGYKADVDPQIANIFSTAAYRLGHTLLSSTVMRVDESGAESEFGNLELLQAFFRPDRLINEGGIDETLRGAAVGEAEEVDTKIINDVRNFLFGPPGSEGLDLASLNIQRGRDHGLPDYNTAREAYGLEQATSWAQITSNTALQQDLAGMYDNIDDLDVFVGGLAEDRVEGAAVGELFQTILADQFTRVRDGDSFWHEATLSPEQLADLKGLKLSDIIERNTDIDTMQDDVFIAFTRKGGTDDDDLLIAEVDKTLLLGGAGDDILVGSHGAKGDELHGGVGNDQIYAGHGEDVLYGGAGDDSLHGEGGHDVLNGGAGNDFLVGGDDDDILNGGTGNDFISLLGGNNTVQASAGHDVVEGFNIWTDVLEFGESPNAVNAQSFEGGTLITDTGGNTTWLIGVTSSEYLDIRFDDGSSSLDDHLVEDADFLAEAA